MQDIIITSKRLKKELYLLLFCFIITNIIHIAAIISYQTSWWELLSQMGYVLVISIALYLLLWLIRLLYLLLKLPFKKFKRR